eukprot:CAMPEP_0177773442 /NCGR_PEP_ID=MMETSP0491_2-20121128/12877_1 /TAXON_ID=63592 /ORGANISM="Tetraselmis chuii, Strain PLY429" /LENGTH=78 /DNA_ID=CAMNT_0019291557 /DNA_START=496 /DNA_END=729 /DNA_ORIENTATION=-
MTADIMPELNDARSRLTREFGGAGRARAACRGFAVLVIRDKALQLVVPGKQICQPVPMLLPLGGSSDISNNGILEGQL